MPFAQQTPRAFIRTNIVDIPPNHMGVYGLYQENRWIYIGSGDIRARLLAHLNGDNPSITREQPTHWVDEVGYKYVEREKDLILELNPVCNRRVG